MTQATGGRRWFSALSVLATVAMLAASLSIFASPASAASRHHTAGGVQSSSSRQHDRTSPGGNGGNGDGNGYGNSYGKNDGNNYGGNYRCDRYEGNRDFRDGRDVCVCSRVLGRGHHSSVRCVLVPAPRRHRQPTPLTTTTAPSTTTTVAPTTTTSSTTTTTAAPTTTTSSTTTTTAVPGTNCAATISGTALSRTGWVASTDAPSSSADAPANALDGNLATRFSTDEHQRPGLDFEVNTGSQQTFDELVMEVPNSPNDYARDFVVEVSNDGVTWDAVALCTGTGTPQVVSFPTQTAQYVRVVLTAGETTYWWSIDEFYLYNS